MWISDFTLLQGVDAAQLSETCLKSQHPATQTFPFKGEESDCAANRSLVVSSLLRSHDSMDLNQTHKTHDMAKSSPLSSSPVTVVLTETCAYACAR